MGSPITTWEGAEAFFTGAGGATSGIILVLSIAACVGALVIGTIMEERAHDKHK